MNAVINKYLPCQMHEYIIRMAFCKVRIFKGHEALEYVHIENQEDMALPFAFDEASCHSPGMGVSLKVKPLTGTVPPRSK